MTKNKSEKINIKVGKKPTSTAKPIVPKRSNRPVVAKSSPKSKPRHILDHPDAQLDGGFDSAMHRPGETVHPGLVPSPAPTVPLSPPVVANPNSEADAVYESDEDFYSSKLDAKGTKSPHRSGHLTPLNPGTDYLRLGFLIFLLIATTIAAFMFLYQLEQLQPGAGLIFDYWPF